MITNESQNIEWKKSWRDEYPKWICGFANAQGGKIYIGKTDNGKLFQKAKATISEHIKSIIFTKTE